MRFPVAMKWLGAVMALWYGARYTHDADTFWLLIAGCWLMGSLVWHWLDNFTGRK